jgi:acyl carrier protein
MVAMNCDETIKKLLAECKIEYNGDKEAEMYIQSVQLVSLVVALEEEFDIEILDQYMIFDNLNTFKKIENMLETVKGHQ